MDETNLEDALEQQQMLVESSLAAVFAAYDGAIEQKIEQPVIMVVDCMDDIGAEIARGWLGDQDVDDAIADRQDDEETVVYSAAFSWEGCRQEVPELFPYLAPMFEQPWPEDGVLVIGVTSGGASALTAPFEARP